MFLRKGLRNLTLEQKTTLETLGAWKKRPIIEDQKIKVVRVWGLQKCNTSQKVALLGTVLSISYDEIRYSIIS